MRLLALCGSLRAGSSSAALLRAIGDLAPAGTEFGFFDGVRDLPLFNPDIEPAPPASVLDFWRAAAWADAIVVASPEYAHGVTGAIKNALDWLVGQPTFGGTPVAVLNPSARARHADRALRETLRTMSAVLIPGACVRVPVMAMDKAGILRDAGLSGKIRRVLAATVNHVASASN